MDAPDRDAAEAAAPVAPWPDWLEACRVEDSVAATAYEATPPRCRAALKTGLALAHFHFGESADSRYDAVRNGRLGFLRARRREPAPWALVILSPAYAAAARVTAACAAALLAGVPHVGAICPGATPRPAALVSLELSGVEDIFQPDMTAMAALFEELAALPGPRGRVVLLHAGECADLARLVRRRGIPCHEEARPPRLRVEPDAGIDRDLLAFAHGGPDALEAALRSGAPVDVVYRRPVAGDAPAPEARLTLAAGCEGFWLHPGLGPEFFTISRQAFAPLWDLAGPHAS